MPCLLYWAVKKNLIDKVNKVLNKTSTSGERSIWRNPGMKKQTETFHLSIKTKDTFPNIILNLKKY